MRRERANNIWKQDGVGYLSLLQFFYKAKRACLFARGKNFKARDYDFAITSREFKRGDADVKPVFRRRKDAFAFDDVGFHLDDGFGRGGGAGF